MAIRAIASDLSDDDYANAYDAAQQDLGLSSDPSNTFMEGWTIKRMKRWIYQYKLEASAENFNVPKANLRQVFENYSDLVKKLDYEFLQAKNENPVEFGLVSNESDTFGMVATSGFVNNDNTGEDLTYESTQGVLINGR